MKQLLLAFSLIGSLETSALAHLFTDTTGRRVEADLVGMRGENVVLQVNDVRGQWPLKQLSAADQEYVRNWKAENSGIEKVQVRAFEKAGMGPQGEFPAAKSTPAAPPLPATTTQATYQHYEVEVSNPSKVDASVLRVEYVLYVLNPDGSVGANAGEHSLSGLKAGAAQKFATHGQTAKKTKTSVLKLNYNSQTAGLSVTEKNARSKERFGGVWVKVRGIDGGVIGETKKLLPELEKANPEWTEMAVKEDIPVLKSLADLLELLKNAIPNAPKTGGPGPLPKLPIGR